MAITLVPIHRNGSHQRSLQMHDINDAYAEIRRQGHNQDFPNQRPHKYTQFRDEVDNPIVKFCIINGDKAEVVDVKGFNRLRV